MIYNCGIFPSFYDSDLEQNWNCLSMQLENYAHKVSFLFARENENSFSFSIKMLHILASKVKRRTPHNMIEKKYRSTINDAIRELKNIVSSPDEKLSKSGVLRSTLNYIYVLKQEKRKLQEEVYFENFVYSPIVRPCFIWSVNIFVIICFLTRLLVFGEPVVDADSSAWTYFLKLRKNACSCIKAGDYKGAERNLRECLKVLERPLPTTKYDEYVSVIWQVIRHILNSIWIGRCFSRIQRSASKTVPVVCRSHAQTAIVYHLLNQIYLTQLQEDCNELPGLNFALCAVNLAESAGCSSNGLSHALMADIYFNAALQMKLFFPSFIAYFIRRAKSHIKATEEGVKRKFMWLFHPLARNFLNCRLSLFEQLRGRSKLNFLKVFNSKPVERLLAVVKMKLLKSLVEELDSSSGVGISYFCEVSNLLLTICTIVSELDVTSFDGQGDEVCSWWTNAFICALYWREHKYGSAADHFAAVRRCPKKLLTEPISLALGHALCSRKLCIHDRDNIKFPRIVWFHSSLSIVRLRSLAVIDHDFHSNLIEFITVIRLLSLEWLLISVFDVWQTSLNYAKPYWQQLPEILTTYRSLAKKDEKCKHKVSINVYELVSRVLNGVNPINTWNDLEVFYQSNTVKLLTT
uniref:BHLH domain-containing protein n=1 Tax=Syphacia muris TaxID=451379 RepID=A0A0N5AE33_9BILA